MSYWDDKLCYHLIDCNFDIIQNVGPMVLFQISMEVDA